MKSNTIRTIHIVMLLCAGCVGTIEAETAPDVSPETGEAALTLRSSAKRWRKRSYTPSVSAPAADSGSGVAAPAPVTTVPPSAASAPQPAPAPSTAPAATPAPAATQPAPAATQPAPIATPKPAATTPVRETIGVGDFAKPAVGPAARKSAAVGGAPFVLVKNWNFGANGTIKNTADLSSEFSFHDHWNTIANGANYGAVTVAPNTETAISSGGLGLKDDMQPVEDPSRPTREFTGETLETYVRPLSASQTTIDSWAHNAGNGSFTAKWKLPAGGALYDRDILWETRVRIPTPQPGYWFSLWTSGTQWDRGAEMDVVESFGTPNIGPGANAFHVNSVGGKDKYEYNAWPSELQNIGVPEAARNLSQWHVFTWVYKTDDTYQVFYDDYLVQEGTIHWTFKGEANGQAVDMNFLFDFSWGHTQVQDVNISLPTSNGPVVYEVDYSRVYMR